MLVIVGEVATCLACHKTGHTRANCPGALPNLPAPAVDMAAVTSPVLLSPGKDDIVKELVGAVVVQVTAKLSNGLLSFAEAVKPGLGAKANVNDDGHHPEQVAKVNYPKVN